MAQAARLSLRMQKELKLLLTDPPHGASFPVLSPDSDLSDSLSLSSIDAQIEGPDGTVYAKGVFKIRIQIPERYPFQPPIVTFATPIYHPNIDNGGRICLDILNLPPKGAWQPSLNISTVLTSIGLLLSEPNPDDGLMCEASREYKYNRQAFDQKARSMTEKYARAEARGNDSGSKSFRKQTNASMMETKVSDGLKGELDECFISHKTLCGNGRKLFMGCSGSHQDCDGGVNEVPIHPLLESQMEVIGPKEESKQIIDECHQNRENLQWTKRKLSLGSLGPTQTRGGDDKDNLVPKHHSSLLNSPNITMASKESSSVKQESHYNQEPPHQDGESISVNDSLNASLNNMSWVGQKVLLESSKSGQMGENTIEKQHSLPQPSLSHANVSHWTLPLPQATSHIERQADNDYSSAKRKKLCLAGKKLSLGLLGSSQGQETDNKENAAPSQSLPLSSSRSSFFAGSVMSSLTPWVGEHLVDITGTCSKKVGQKNCGTGRKLPLEPVGQLQRNYNIKSALHLNSGDLKTASPKTLHVPNDCKVDEKQWPMQDCDEEFAEGIKQQAEGSPEEVIVLDSEDSEEESRGSMRSRCLRKNAFQGGGKQKLKVDS